MALYPCSGCGSRPVGVKHASATWAWNDANGRRVAYRQRLCVGCFAQRVLALPLVQADQELTCPYCGISTGEGMDPNYCTAFVPGTGRFDFEWPTCAPCAVQLRTHAQEGGERLEDRLDQFGGLGPGPRTPAGPISATTVWDSLGLRPQLP